MTEDLNKNTASLKEHLAELRIRVMFSAVFFLIAFCFCYYFAQDIYSFLVQPLADMYQDQDGRKLIYTGLTEAFFTYLKLSFYSALFVSFPFIASQLYIFLAPGLYKKERHLLLPFLFATPVLFLAGAALVYYFIIPTAWHFFLSFENMGASGGLPIQLEARVSEYLSLVISLIMAFGIAFQMPVLLGLLAQVGFLSSASLIKKRRYAIVIIFIIAAFITPPDVISQIGLALPMMLLYECSIFLCKWIEKRKVQV
ncbi:MAG: tatC [Rickettsiaceae bacterium]|jgi:sec-independent protein translocase protein TatC|nr:tatC [Rickettsiaceae bacterium]